MAATCRDFILAPLGWKKHFRVLYILNANQSVRVRFCETSSELATILILQVIECRASQVG